MNKKILTAALAAVLILAGCSNGNKPAETTTAAPETTTTTVAPETTKTSEATTTEATTTEATTEASEPTDEDNSNKPKDDEVVLSMGGVEILGKDVKSNEYQMYEYDCGLMRTSTGTYYDNKTNPDWFATDEFTYSGDTVPLGSLTEFRVGDKIGDLTVTEASTNFYKMATEVDDDLNPISFCWYLSHTGISLEGEIKLTGIARYYFDEQYSIGSGDIHFIPDSSYKGLPVPVCFDETFNGSEPTNGYGFTSFDIKGDWNNQSYGGGLCVYTDAPEFRVGNLNSDYSKHTEMYELFDGGNADCTKRVEVTLTDIKVSYSDQFGPTHCSARIKEIKAID